MSASNISNKPAVYTYDPTSIEKMLKEGSYYQIDESGTMRTMGLMDYLSRYALNAIGLKYANIGSLKDLYQSATQQIPHKNAILVTANNTPFTLLKPAEPVYGEVNMGALKLNEKSYPFVVSNLEYTDAEGGATILRELGLLTQKEALAVLDELSQSSKTGAPHIFDIHHTLVEHRDTYADPITREYFNTVFAKEEAQRQEAERRRVQEAMEYAERMKRDAYSDGKYTYFYDFDVELYNNERSERLSMGDVYPTVLRALSDGEHPMHQLFSDAFVNFLKSPQSTMKKEDPNFRYTNVISFLLFRDAISEPLIRRILGEKGELNNIDQLMQNLQDHWNEFWGKAMREIRQA